MSSAIRSKSHLGFPQIVRVTLHHTITVQSNRVRHWCLVLNNDARNPVFTDFGVHPIVIDDTTGQLGEKIHRQGYGILYLLSNWVEGKSIISSNSKRFVLVYHWNYWCRPFGAILTRTKLPSLTCCSSLFLTLS